ncbi:hypothetical protein D3C81_1957570 [compost metagenome]
MADQNILECSAVRIQLRILLQIRPLAADLPSAGKHISPDVNPVYSKVSLVPFLAQRQAAQQRRLAASAGSQQHNQFTRF